MHAQEDMLCMPRRTRRVHTVSDASTTQRDEATCTALRSHCGRLVAIRADSDRAGQHLGHERRKPCAEVGLGGRQRHRPVRAPMEGVLQVCTALLGAQSGGQTGHLPSARCVTSSNAGCAMT